MSRAYATRWREAAPQAEGLYGRARGLARDLVLRTRGHRTRIEGDAFLRGLYCHYVFDDQIDRFRELLVELQKVGTFVDTETCVEMLRGTRPIDGRYFHLSFDDGFRNIRTNAAPVLAELGIPAIAFVPSRVIEADYERTVDYCLNVTRYRGVVEMLSWEETRALPDFGVEVGSHTQTHARLSAISSRAGALEEEIAGSKRDLEDRLGVACRYISWPYGEIGDIDPTAISVVEQAGYDACFSAVRGTIIPGRSDPMRIPRHHFEVQWPESHVRYFLAGHAEA